MESKLLNRQDGSMLNKRQALEILGISERMLQRHAASGRIRVEYVTGRWGLEGRYHKHEIESLLSKKQEELPKVRERISIPLKDAVRLCGVKLRVLSALAESGELNARRINREWHTTIEDLAELFV